MTRTEVRTPSLVQCGPVTRQLRTPALPVIVGLLVCATFAQDAPKFRSSVELVTIAYSVVDEAGSPIQGLTRDDFRVFDNDVPRLVSYFSRDDDQPVTLGIIIDDSDSQHDQRSEHRRVAFALLQRLLRPNDSAFVISIEDQVHLYHDLTLTEMESFGEPCPKHQGVSDCGGSPLWNVVYDAARLKLQGIKGNKALLLLTDGFDTGNVRSWSEAAAAAQKADTAVYAIQYRSASGSSYAPQLYRLVAETAGAWFSAQRSSLDSIVARLEADLRGRYVVGFHPERVTFGKLKHDVRIEVTRPDLAVRARKTYFEEPPQER